MSQQLINHSPDLKRLRDEGYEVEVLGGYLLIHQVPYLNDIGEVKRGTLVSDLVLINNTTVDKPKDHVIHFIGENPCNVGGTVISAIQYVSTTRALREGITVNYSFSNKPQGGYPNYYEKFKRYAEVISAPAKYLHPDLTEKTFKVIPSRNEESVFKYIDTNSSRANIDIINSKFKGQKVAIIGIGGTGAYVLDLVAKTPVQEVHIFDGDHFLQHNSFRSPGAASVEDLDEKWMKAKYFADIYSKMHNGITPHPYYVDGSNYHELDQMDYVFLCVDKNRVRKGIMDYLLHKGIPFIDVGLGVNVVDDKLIGTTRVTAGTPSKNDHLKDRVSEVDDENNEYSTNIQIADLNSLNASLAVIKWKKMCGFYQDLIEEHHSAYSINVSKIFNEDRTA
ncbi:ThiF family adenylyltransferase [Pontibacter mangrovi]|uniref:ThiF family adenylyltransferase n=2 Tax=Pseudomonadati TaxID=3379134 RepID=A0A501WJV8_9RHOB|nr:ThiF family adenylyltransferase [Pontibacter mangrovi]TPE41532.1 ThiF family adenylyltransferase [Pontibacter mangrovi]TPE48660.1 ThiF family adenylyltransferase [Amaricoccus solimangrovi]